MQPSFLIILSLILTQSAMRRAKQSHELSILPESTTLRLCRDFNNPQGFKKILKPILVPRVVDTPQHRQVGEYIRNFFIKLGWTTEWDQFEADTPHGEKTFRNLIVTSDVEAARLLVLACHYDSKILPGKVMIGATDSAVPCAMMMDIAKSLTPYMDERTAKDIALRMIFFDGEEAFVKWSAADSLYGSRHLAEKLEESGEIEKIDVLMLLDLLGAANPTIPNAKGLGATELFDHLLSIEKELHRLGCTYVSGDAFLAKKISGTPQDDHIPFLNRGVPVLHLIPIPYPSVWHTANDNESALHYPTIFHVMAVIRVFVAKYLGITSL